MYLVMFKDGDALTMEATAYGPFRSYDDAYNFLCELPAPREGGFKFVEGCAFPSRAATRDIEAARDYRDAQAIGVI